MLFSILGHSLAFDISPALFFGGVIGVIEWACSSALFRIAADLFSWGFGRLDPGIVVTSPDVLSPRPIAGAAPLAHLGPDILEEGTLIGGAGGGRISGGLFFLLLIDDHHA